MNLSLLKKALPHIIAITVFLVISVVYCKPALDGKVLQQGDVQRWKSMARQSFEYKEKYGHFPLWTGSSFGGMPAYTIAMDPTSKITIGYLSNLLTPGLPEPINFFFLACICFYFLATVLRIDPWIGVLSALAYAYATFNPVLIVVGHNTEMLAIGYAPAVIAGLLLLLRGNYLWGMALFTLFFSLQFSTQHIQVIYYTLLSMGLLTVALFVYSWMADRKQLRQLITGGLFAVICGAIGYGCYATSSLPVQEYAKETIRSGRTELTKAANKNESKNGLSKEYAFEYSYGIGEVLTIMIPDIFGGGDGGREIGDNSKFAEKLAEAGVQQETALQYANQFAYWGDQTFVGGPPYLGAVICFLFIAGLFFTKGWQKWWLVSIAMLGILLAWGKNFPAFNYFLFDHLPFYNKFRSPSMALVLPQMAFPLLGALGLNEMLAKKPNEVHLGKFKLTVFTTAGLLILLAGFYFMASYRGAKDPLIKQDFETKILRQTAMGQQPTLEMQQRAVSFSNALLNGLEQDRQSIYGADLLRTILLIVVAVGLTGLYMKGKFDRKVLIGTLILLSSFDLLAVGRRYLNEESFVEKTDSGFELSPTAADQQIRNDPEKNFRVFDVASGDPFTDARTSYFHNSLGGYSPAKLGLYQDLIEKQLRKGNQLVLNMLNTKYFIQEDPSSHRPVVRLNPGAYGPCWLVKFIHYVKDGDEEMKALDSINTRDTVIIQQKYANLVQVQTVPDTMASIRLIENLNDKIDYHFSAKTNQFAVFSEIYYDRGWNAFLDGNKADYIRVDYALRGMPIPAGEHTIEFRFEPHSYVLGNRIAVWSSIMAYLLLIAAIAGEIGGKGRPLSAKFILFLRRKMKTNY